MNIVYIDSDFIAVDKPAGMPSAPLNQNEINNAVCTVARDFPEVMGVSGRKSIEGGLLHRLDTATRGILLFARNQTAYDSVSRLQQAGAVTGISSAFRISEKQNSIQGKTDTAGTEPFQTLWNRQRSSPAGNR